MVLMNLKFLSVHNSITWQHRRLDKIITVNYIPPWCSNFFKPTSKPSKPGQKQGIGRDRNRESTITHASGLVF